MEKIRGKQIAMIFQEPMTALNPVMTIGKQIGECLKLHHPEMKLDMDTADDFINLALRDIRPDITPREIVELFR